MAKVVIDGGLLNGLVVDTDKPRPPLVARQDDPQELFDLIERGAEQQAELVAQERQQAAGDELEAAVRPYLKNELRDELDGGGTAEQRRNDIAKLKACCDRWNLPFNLPRESVPWAGVAAFLIEEGDHGIEHVTRLRNSISFSHRSMNLADPTADHLINAVLRSIANRKDVAPAS
jgi:hypothetical protein